MTLPYGFYGGSVPHDPGGGALIGQALTGLGEGLKHVIDPNYELQKQVQAAMVLHPELGQALSNREYLNPGSLEDLGLTGRVGQAIKQISPSPEARAAADIIHQTTPGDTKAIQGMWEKLPDEMKDKVAPMLGMETSEQTLQRRMTQLNVGQEERAVQTRSQILQKYPQPPNEAPQDALQRYGNMGSELLSGGDVKGAQAAFEAMRNFATQIERNKPQEVSAGGQRVQYVPGKGFTTDNGKTFSPTIQNTMTEDAKSEADLRRQEQDETRLAGTGRNFINENKDLIARRNQYIQTKTDLDKAMSGNPEANSILPISLGNYFSAHARMGPAIIKLAKDVGGGGAVNTVDDAISVIAKGQHDPKLLQKVSDLLDSENAADKQIYKKGYEGISKTNKGIEKYISDFSPDTWDYESPSGTSAPQTPAQKYGPPPKF